MSYLSANYLFGLLSSLSRFPCDVGGTDDH